MRGPFLSRWHATLRLHGAGQAVVEADSGRTLTFAELDTAARARCAAPDFTALRGRRVLLHRPNGAAWLIDFLALHLAGATILPVDAETPAPAVKALATRLRAAAILDESGVRTLTAMPVGSGRHFLGKLTSGSTGEPKAYLFTEAQMLADADAIRTGMGLRSDDLNHAGLPFAHSYALGNLILPLFAHGLPLVVASSHFPGVIAEEIARHRATVFPTVPAIIAALHRSDIPAPRLASLRTVISAGARLDPADAEAFARKFGLAVHNFYGSSETGGIAYATTPARNPAAVGRALPGVRIRTARDGRLLVSGPAVFTHGNRRKTPAGLGAHRLADFGSLAPEGTLLLRGRASDLIKIGGRRIAPAEVEPVLRTLPGVSDAFVHEVLVAGEPRLAALLIGPAADTRALRARLRPELAPWKIPTRFVFAAETPLTGRGKPDRAAIRRLLTLAD